MPATVAQLAARLDEVDYLAPDGLAAALFLAVAMPQPILLEGEAGAGKTEAAKALARALDTPLLRLQCYEGISAAEALYEWNYQRQLLAIRLAEAAGKAAVEAAAEADLFSRAYLLARPLLAALEHPGPRPAVLLIDEIDRADDEFEAFLLELLAESSVTIPELGAVRALHPPIVVLTSNRTRELHDALKRRCLYWWLDHPEPALAARIIRRRSPQARLGLAETAARAVARLRELDLQKPPGVAEAINWVAALTVLGLDTLDAAAMGATLGAVLKHREDQEAARAAGLERLVGG
ncbi:MAG: AAA family ATPase [Acidimicrobiales bacterium]